MGLLDNRIAPGYNSRLEKMKPLYKAFSGLLTLRKSTVVNMNPIKTFRFYPYHLLTQQGIPGNIKVIVVLLALSSPIVLTELISSRSHPQWKSPFRI